MLQHLSAPPQHLTRAQHDELMSSTPTSFAAIPPLLHWSDEDVQVILNPSTGWNGWDAPVKGTLAVSFLPVSPLLNPNELPQPSGEETGSGFTLPFPALTLHAMTPATPAVPAHLYCQIDESDAPPSVPIAPENGNGIGYGGDGVNGEGHVESLDDSEDDTEDDFTPMRELRVLLPEAKLRPLFAALSACSALHASLLPNGEPSSFVGFGDQADGPDTSTDWEDEDVQEDDDDANGGETVEGGEQDGQGEGGRIDPIERFIGLVDWAGIFKPPGWEEAGQFEDMDGDGI